MSLVGIYPGRASSKWVICSRDTNSRLPFNVNVKLLRTIHHRCPKRNMRVCMGKKSLKLRWIKWSKSVNNYYTVRSDDVKVLKSRWNFVKMTKTTTPGNNIYTLLINFIAFTSFNSSKFQTLFFPHKLSYYAWATCDTHEGFFPRNMLQAHFARASTHEGAFSSSLNLPRELAPKYLTG